MSATLMVNSAVQMVSDSVRNENARAIEMRNQWRRQYTELTQIIRELKRQRALGYTNHFTLRTLQEKAQVMMARRLEIKMKLIITAYDYV